MRISLHITKNKMKHIFICIMDFKGRHANKKFTDYMQQKAKQFNMKNSFFANASGATKHSYATSSDLLRLLSLACTKTEITNIWNLSNSTLKVSGKNCREIHISSQLTQNNRNELLPYQITGVKSGSWNNSHKALLMNCSTSFDDFMLSLMVNDTFCFNNIYSISKELCDYIKFQKIGSHLDCFLNSGGSFSVKYNGKYISHNDNTKHLPASTTKLLTVLCALDYFSLTDRITIHEIDITSGSGSNYYNGDILTVEEALKGILLESSNTLAQALGRATGEKIISLTKMQ